MKKILILMLMLFMFSCFSMHGLCEDKMNTGLDAENKETITTNTKTDVEEIRSAVDAYKKGDNLACISILQQYTAKQDKNALAWYYLGNSYMNIGMQDRANEAFDKVVKLNMSPRLTSYAIQAQLCMKNKRNCKYENFTASEIKKLKEDPNSFIEQYYRTLSQKAVKSDDVIQIERLINGYYSNNIHEDASNFIRNERTKMKASEINSGRN